MRNHRMLVHQPSLVEQAYEALLGEIADGTLAPNTYLLQEALAARYGVSRQPIQQALLLLKNDGLVTEAGKRGLVVAPLDVRMMRDRYQVRAALERALAHAPALIDVVTSQDAVSSDAKKGLGYVPDYQALEAWNDAELKWRQTSA